MIGFVAESRGDFEKVLSVLVARVMEAEGVEGFADAALLRAAVLDGHPSAFVDVHDAIARCRERGIRVHGPRASLGVRSVRAALILFERFELPNVDAVVVALDLDRDPGRADRVRRARDEAEWPFAVALALPQPELEAWVLLGFEATTDEERTTLESVRKSIGFDPTLHPERLTSTSASSPKDAKVVCARLVPARERRNICLEQPLERLAERGAACGLGDFLRELAERVAPALRR